MIVKKKGKIHLHKSILKVIMSIYLLNFWFISIRQL